MLIKYLVGKAIFFSFSKEKKLQKKAMLKIISIARKKYIHELILPASIAESFPAIYLFFDKAM